MSGLETAGVAGFTAGFDDGTEVVAAFGLAALAAFVAFDLAGCGFGWTPPVLGATELAVPAFSEAEFCAAEFGVAFLGTAATTDVLVGGTAGLSGTAGSR
jgi:hypothetical protein